MWSVNEPDCSLFYKHDGTGWLWSNDKETWYFTFRGFEEIKRMWPNIVRIDTCSTDVPNDDETEDQLRELFGETLDDPIPDDLWEMICDTES